MTTLDRTKHLLVSRRDPATRRYRRVGVLSHDGTEYSFVYDDTVDRPIPGLPLGKTHRDPDLFPFFAERIMDPHRPERVQTLENLGLTAEAGPLDVLAVSGGGRTGDTFELTPLPEPGLVDIPFLVHGIRHLSDKERASIDELSVGDELHLRCEPGNPINERALLVTQAGARLGYVPDPLLGYVHGVMAGPHRLTVERVNAAEAGLHTRLLVRLRGELRA